MTSPGADVDAVVVGSGLGGLAAAVALARSGRRVAVFEQHTLPGGWAHSFTLEGYTFCPGLHYVGELGPGGGFRALLEGLGLGPELVFYQQNPQGYEHALVGGERFDWPAGREALQERLIDRFPAERRGIVRYFDVITRMYADLGLVPAGLERDGPALPPLTPALALHGWKRLDRFLEGFVSDPLLRGFLLVQAGDHAVSPRRCPALVHTSVTCHYLDGGWFPQGGGRGLVKAFVHVLRRHGGSLHVGSRVESLLLEGDAAVGVRLADGTEVRAPIVISDADPGVTWGSLVPPSHRRGPDVRRLKRERWSAGMVSLFFAVDAPVRELGLDSGNVWYHASTDVGATYVYAEEGVVDPPPPIPGLYLGCSSLKDPTARHDGHHTFEAFSFVPTAPFERWASSEHGRRPPDYASFKETYADRMLEAIERAVPGLRERVVFRTVGTPLTNRYYVASTRGAAYGTSRRLRNLGPFGHPVRTRIAGLFQCGSSTICHGAYGATLSGVVAAELALGCRRSDLLDASPGPLTVRPAEPTG